MKHRATLPLEHHSAEGIFEQMFLCRVVDSYLKYLSALLFLIFTKRPETLKSDEKRRIVVAGHKKISLIISPTSVDIRQMPKLTHVLFLLGFASFPSLASAMEPLPMGAKVFVAPMDGFESYLIAALNKKRVPLVVVADKEKADFSITGAAESQKAGWAKILLTSSAQSREEASINVIELKSGTVVFAYAVNKGNSVHGKQSTAEACAKHLKEFMEKK
jgi:hypothetical protein